MAGGGHSFRDGLKDPKRREREREKEREKVKKGFFCTSERENKIFAEVPVGVTVSIVVNATSDIPVVFPPIFLRTIFHNLFLNKKSFSFSEKMKMLCNGTLHHK